MAEANPADVRAQQENSSQEQHEPTIEQLERAKGWNNLEELAQMRLAWISRLSDAERAKLIEERDAWANDTTKGERMTEIMTLFAESDSNNDCLLDRAELEAFLSKMLQKAGERGVPAQSTADFDENIKEKAYAFYNSATTAYEGVAVMDFMQCTIRINNRVAELMSGN